MEFKEIKETVKGINFEELRNDSDVYLEVVILRKDLAHLTSSLTKYFGLPAWPSKNKLTPKMEESIADFGGVMAGQTLYFNSDATQVIFAMLWPWQDRQHITMKMVLKKQ